MNKYTLVFILMVLSIFSTTVVAQQLEKCATMTVLERAFEKDPTLKQRMADAEKANQEYLQNALLPISGDNVVSIPVVFHIIHNGEALGTINNPDDTKIMMQLARLNEDFRSTNTDKLVSGDPFFPEQADAKIEFCLAKRDTFGNPTTGINRYNMGKLSHTIAEVDNDVKPNTVWKSSDYLNIWCVNLDDPGSPGIDGYATFPGGDANVDGCVVASFAFGDANGSGKSIVATHEIGHYLNLTHIWGDARCGDDFVDDTPQAVMDNSGCPIEPHNVDSCVSAAVNPRGEMFMNYMDYSDAVCTVMFTTGQKARMRATLSGPRASLLTSQACEVPAANEAEILAQTIKISPNPSSDNFRIESSDILNKDVSITVYNQIGVAVRQYKNVNQFPFTIYTNGMPNGMYYATFGTQNHYASKKLLLVR